MASLLSSGDQTLAQITQYYSTSADLSFDNSYYFASDSYGYGGYESFKVYYWNTTTSSWEQKYYQEKAQTNFGHQIACTWDGDRFVVGSPDENKVYVYHSPGGSGSQKWTHNASGVVTSPTVYTITCPDSSTTGRRFGWSVSIAKDQGNHIIIGAPGDFTQSDSDGQKRGKVYIYEFNGSTWSKTFEKTADQANTDCDGNTGNNACVYQPQVQRYPSATTSGQAFYRVTDSSPQFGYYVDISGYAEYIAIGVPGTGVGRLSALNMDGYTGTIDVIRSGSYSDYIEDIAMLGCIVCYKTTNANKSWSSNTSIHGKPVLGQTEMSLDAVPALYEPQESFDFTALGTTCKISLDGTRLIGGSPRYSYPGKQSSPHFGRLDAWNYSTTDSDWVLGKGRVVGHRVGNRLGLKIAIDYTGQRVAALLMEEPDIYAHQPDRYTNKAGLMVYDWNGNGFYEVTPEVPFASSFVGSVGHNTYASVAISKGDIISAYAHDNRTTSFYFYKLTAGFDGNSLVGGYCAADTFLVGPNDGSTQNTFKKQIKFGGTFFDNTYDNTTIENRIYQFDSEVGEVNHQGYSELILSKKTTGAAPDMIRLKSNELRIDNYVSLDQGPLNWAFSASADGEYDHHGALLMNVAGNFKINPEYDISRYSGSSANVETFADTQAEVKASLDVEGDIFGRRRINAGYLNGQQILGRKFPWQILYDTRSGRVKQGDDLISNTFCEFNAANVYKHGRLDSKGTKSGNMVTHYETQGAITFTSANDYILNNDSNVVKEIYVNGISGSLWIKLINDHSTYNSSGVTLVSYGIPHATNHTGFRLQVTNDNICLNFGTGKIQPSPAYSFKKDKWYHVYYAFKPLEITTLSNTDLWINGVNVTLTSDGTLSNASGYDPNHYIGSPLGDSATNVYIGMVAHFDSHINTQFHLYYVNYVGQFPNASEMYNWGSPQEKLVVGGDAFIENRLSIGGTHSPDYPLDVTGDINLTGNIYQDGETFYASPWSFNTTIPTPMTSSSSGGYTVSDSSNLGTGYEGWNAFDASSSTSWATNTNYLGSSTGSYYNGTTSTTYNGSLTVNGDWVQVQTPVGIITNKIDILPFSTSNEQCPRTGKLLGSNDGSTWTEIHSFTNQTYTQGQYTTISFTNTTAYSYFRLVCEDMEYVNSSTNPRTGATIYYSSVITIDEIRFYGTSPNIYYNTGNVGIGTGFPEYDLDVSGDINCTGTLSKGSGSFKIDHPLPSMSNTHYLYHSFIEGPRADLIYRGVIDLVNGSASVNLDTVSNMTDGTFEALNRNVQCFVSNESDWDAVKGSVSGNILTISCQNTSSTTKVSWMVVGERKDKHMYDTVWTDNEGCVVPEKLK